MTTFISNREIYERVVREADCAAQREQFNAVWRGAFCRDCGRRAFCVDPILGE